MITLELKCTNNLGLLLKAQITAQHKAEGNDGDYNKNCHPEWDESRTVRYAMNAYLSKQSLL